MTILVLTVGGSYQPIVTAVEALAPDRIVFLCSDDTPTARGSWVEVVGEGLVLKSRRDLERPDLPNIATLCRLRRGGFEVHKIREFDSLEACYGAARDVLDRLRSDWPEVRIVADYSGGTKSMTAGLALAAVDDEHCELSVVTGTRADRERVRDRTQFTQPVAVWEVRARRQLREVAARVACYEYAGAASLLETIARLHLGPGLRDTVRSWISICRGLDAWDRFAHAEARALLEPYRALLVPHWVMLDSLCHPQPRDPYLRVDDLLFNAERRAEQGRFDDAVARAYRALELIAQIRLRTRHTIDTGNVDVTKLPEALRAELAWRARHETRVQIGLMQAWDLLCALSDAPLAGWFAATRGEIRGLLEVRNGSILAHGDVPIDRELFRGKGARLIGSCREALAFLRESGRQATGLQLPRGLPEERREIPTRVSPGRTSPVRDGDLTEGIGTAAAGPRHVPLVATDASAVAQFAARVRAELGAELVDLRLFGSKATGDDVPGSDIDILVVVQDARIDVEDRVIAIAFDVNLAHDVYISPRVVGRATLEHPVWRITPFLRAALAGIPV